MRKTTEFPPGAPVTMSPEAFEDAVPVLKALGSRPRASLLRLLASENGIEHSVGEIEQILGLSQSAVSQHLRILRKAGIVTTRRDRQSIYYSLSDERVREILRILAY